MVIRVLPVFILTQRDDDTSSAMLLQRSAYINYIQKGWVTNTLNHYVTLINTVHANYSCISTSHSSVQFHLQAYYHIRVSSIEFRQHVHWTMQRQMVEVTRVARTKVNICCMR